MRRDVDRVEEDILELGVAVAAQDAQGVLDVARIDRVAAFEQVVKFAQDLACESLLGMRTGNLERGSRAADAYSECGLERPQMRVMLPEQIGEQARIVEVEFERIVSIGIGYF
ncbi:MAG: hypothetical protein ACYDC3_11430 [Candidatus Binataceae bacterium]